MSERNSNVQRPAGRRPLTDAQRRRIIEKRRRARKRKRILTFILILLAIICAVVVGLVLISNSNNDLPEVTPTGNTVVPKTTRDDAFANYTPQQTSDESIILGANSISVEDLSINTDLDDTWLNVLLLGLDTRVAHEPARSDTMIICSINKRTGEVKLSSIMRDMAVPIEGHGIKRVNNAYFYGGERLAMKTINECFEMNIQYYVTVDFFGFSVIAETLGGTYINITEAEMNEINSNAIETYMIAIDKGYYTYEEAEKEYFDTLLTQCGANIKLTGIQTLAYARIRKIDHDYARAERQRNVLNALMSNIKNSDASQLSRLALNCMPYIKTNMELSDIINVATRVLNRENFATAKEFRLPDNGTYKEETRNNESMLYDTDFALNAKRLRSFIYIG